MEMVRNLVLSATEKEPAPANWMVVVMGIGIVFVGLVLIILICKVMGMFFNGEGGSAATAAPTATAKAAPVAAKTADIQNRQEIIAAVTAACAEEMGKDVSALRVVSFKKI